MKPIAWMVGGFALSGLAAWLKGVGDAGTALAGGMPLYVPALLMLLAGQFCLWRGIRSGIAMLWTGAFDRRRTTPEADTVRPAHGVADAEPVGDFDADAAFARYLARREAEQASPADQPGAAAPSRPARPTFGRRAV